MKKASNIITLIALVIIIALIGTISFGYYKKATMEVKNPIVTMEVQDYGTIKIELYPDQAPQTVANFVNLVQNGYYNGLKFHRVVDGFMIQGGDKNGDGTGSPSLSDLGDLNGEEDREYSIKGEFLLNGVENKIKHEEGVISMARGDYTSYSSSLTEESYNSAGSQFFIMTATNSSLDGSYAGFGRVIEGMDVVHKIEKVEVEATNTSESTDSEGNSEESEKSKPVNDVIITKVEVDTFGVNYDKPETLKKWNYYDWIQETYGINLRQYQ